MQTLIVRDMGQGLGMRTSIEHLSQENSISLDIHWKGILKTHKHYYNFEVTLIKSTGCFFQDISCFFLPSLTHYLKKKDMKLPVVYLEYDNFCIKFMSLH